MIKFYDTNAILNLGKDIFTEEKFYISNITLMELENIKTSSTKDETTKYQARHLLHLLNDNQDKWNVIMFNPSMEYFIEKSNLIPNNDSKIIACVNYLMNIIDAVEQDDEVIFYTSDLACKMLAKSLGIKCAEVGVTEDNYQGFKEVDLNDDELAKFYADFAEPENIFNLLPNEYLVIKSNNKIIDKYKWTGKEYKPVKYTSIDNQYFDKVKPKDVYQQLALDSLNTNQLTVLRGQAGSGKSLLGLGHLFDLLERGKIDKVVIFCNTVATKDACKLGFYPGTKDEKLLDSQIGNFLTTKLGGAFIVEELIRQEKLILVPVADCRGMDMRSLNAGIYFTEAQNATIDMVKLMLQRIDENSICIFEGDDKSQVDMASYGGANNGLRRLSEVFRGEPYYGEITLQTCYRSKIAARAELM